MLSDWAIPEGIEASAPTSPYFFDPAVFTAASDDALGRRDDTPSDRAAREAMPPGGVVVDVGCGAGAASLRLGATRVVGVDPNLDLLDAFADRASRLGIDHTTIQGSWPDVAPQAPTADVVVCHHVVYNVAELAAFVRSLTEHATRRVVLELTAVHPMSWLAPYWKALHGLDQPQRPVVEDALAVLDQLDVAPKVERWTRPIQMIGETGDQQLARVARRLCVGPNRHAQLREALDATPPPVQRGVVTVWWNRGDVPDTGAAPQPTAPLR